MNIKIELMSTTETLLDEISNKELHKKDIAQTYALALKSSEKTDWGKVNQAIIDRWSLSALKDIKEWVWSGKCFE